MLSDKTIASPFSLPQTMTHTDTDTDTTKCSAIRRSLPPTVLLQCSAIGRSLPHLHTITHTHTHTLLSEVTLASTLTQTDTRISNHRHKHSAQRSNTAIGVRDHALRCQASHLDASLGQYQDHCSAISMQERLEHMSCLFSMQYIPFGSRPSGGSSTQYWRTNA